jgi:hypothetical protein
MTNAVNMTNHRRSPHRLLRKHSIAATFATVLLHQPIANGLELTSLHNNWASDADATSLHQGTASLSSQYTSSGSNSNPNNDAGYGVDCSFPTQHTVINDHANSPFDSAERQEYYNEFLKECRKKLHPAEYLCDESEKARIATNLLQPARMKVSKISCMIICYLSIRLGLQLG